MFTPTRSLLLHSRQIRHWRGRRSRYTHSRRPRRMRRLFLARRDLYRQHLRARGIALKRPDSRRRRSRSLGSRKYHTVKKWGGQRGTLLRIPAPTLIWNSCTLNADTVTVQSGEQRGGWNGAKRHATPRRPKPSSRRWTYPHERLWILCPPITFVRPLSDPILRCLPTDLINGEVDRTSPPGINPVVESRQRGEGDVERN